MGKGKTQIIFDEAIIDNSDAGVQIGVNTTD
jgi:hypothetical protein